MTLADFDYHLPPERIAQTPVSPRDSSKLLIVDRHTGQFQDKHFADLADLLTDRDVLVVNDTKVIPARILAHTQSGKPVELLIEKEVEVTADTISWDALTKPGIHEGEILSIPNTPVQIRCTGVHDYLRTLCFSVSREQFFSLLDKWAKTPIPPYIKWKGTDEQELREKYQTVYARYDGAVAAPTAGLHFTTELLERIKKKGVQIETVTLHVGLGTFLPVKTDDITAHQMHAERFSLTQPVAANLNEAKQAGKRIIAVGTTTVRVLESCTTDGLLVPQTGETSIFLYPPARFQFVDALITNFHTPKSTLLMLISAFVSAPNTPTPFSTFQTSLVGRAYAHALEHDYRFYSFGDAMWIQ